jgi:hypothetical protein
MMASEDDDDHVEDWAMVVPGLLLERPRWEEVVALLIE